MPFVPVENAVLVEFRYDYLLQKCENTLWFLGDEAPDSANMSTLAANLGDWWAGAYAVIANNALQLREIVVTDMTTDTGPQVTHTTGLPLSGEIAEEALPSSVSLAVSFRTDSRGRSFRGRNYFVGMSRTQYSGNIASAPFVAALVTGYEALLGGASSPGYNWVVASRFSGINPTTGKPIPRAAGITSLITAVTVADDKLDNQRRRAASRGQ